MNGGANLAHTHTYVKERKKLTSQEGWDGECGDGRGRRGSERGRFGGRGGRRRGGRSGGSSPAGKAAGASESGWMHREMIPIDRLPSPSHLWAQPRDWF